jgi:hypothetical protein
VRNDATSIGEYFFRKNGGSKTAYRNALSSARRGQTLINLELFGAAALEQALRDLGTDQNIRRTLKRAVLAALEPTAKSARAKAPRGKKAIRTKSGKTIDPGTYAETIDVSVTLSRRARAEHTPHTGPTEAEAFVGPKPAGPGVLEEFGTATRHWRNGKSVGFAAAHPHMRPAWEETKDEVLVLLGKMLWVEIAATANRLARRQANALKNKAS